MARLSVLSEHISAAKHVKAQAMEDLEVTEGLKAIDSRYKADLYYAFMVAVQTLSNSLYNTIGTNWERAGNIRYSVICKGAENLDPTAAQERGKAVAEQWAKAMEDGKNGTVRDFVAVGDVEIKVIGGEAPILDSEVPVRQILEQLVAKTGLPPFLLGLSWSTTERMSTQQADLLTSELWALRRTVEPAMRKICQTFLALEGLDNRVELLWDDISLQDITQQAQAELYGAQAEKYRAEAARP